MFNELARDFNKVIKYSTIKKSYGSSWVEYFVLGRLSEEQVCLPKIATFLIIAQKLCLINSNHMVKLRGNIF